MSESGGMSVNCLTAGGQNVATDVKGNITTLPVNLRPAGSTTAMNLNWDSDNKLRSADIDANGTADVNFQYDALGRRVARSGTGGSVVFVQMDQQTIADYPVGGAATTPTFRYVYASYIDEPVVRKTAGTGGTLVYFHRNHQYSITAVTTSAGAISERYAYTAYGQPTILNASGSPLTPQASSLTNRYSYTGREWDATLGLHYFRARWMSPSAGRFITRDPIGYVDGPSLFRAFFIMDATDPRGQNASGIQVGIQNSNNGDCGRESNIFFTFRLPAGHRKKGYLVQKVTVSCSIAPCEESKWIEESYCGNIPHEFCGCRKFDQNSFTYFEAWRVGFNQVPPMNPPGIGNTRWDDKASFLAKDKTCGKYNQEGELRFYSDEDTGDISTDQEWAPKPNHFFGEHTNCKTTAGSLYSRDGFGGDPGFWTSKPIASGSRTMKMDWQCCDCKGKKRFVKLEPEK